MPLNEFAELNDFGVLRHCDRKINEADELFKRTLSRKRGALAPL
jgi:hypothetical protein